MMACQITEEQHNYTLLIDYINRLLMKKKNSMDTSILYKSILIIFSKILYSIVQCEENRSFCFVLF